MTALAHQSVLCHTWHVPSIGLSPGDPMISIYGWESQDSERLSGLPKVTPAVRSRTGPQAQALKAWTHASAEARCVQGLSGPSLPASVCGSQLSVQVGKCRTEKPSFRFCVIFLHHWCWGQLNAKGPWVLLPCRVYLLSNDTVAPYLRPHLNC